MILFSKGFELIIHTLTSHIRRIRHYYPKLSAQKHRLAHNIPQHPKIIPINRKTPIT